MELDMGDLYLGRTLDDDQPVVYSADGLTTHGVIVGMTGSGKTGLGIGLIEEALLNGIPCLVIDPKGDMGNLALTFPELAPGDFEPWIDPASATRSGKSVSELAAEVAATWRQGLEAHGIDGGRIERLRSGSEVTIYTPGSGAGVGLNVLGSLSAPDLDWDTQAELIREEIQSLISSILTLAGIDSDPVSGPEHILLATIVETLWRQGKQLDLATLVGQIPKPPFRKLGVFDIDAFIPEKKRLELALRLNGLLASPSFAAWLEGTPLDISAMIGGTGPTKAAIVYIAHLSDEERQFLVTLLLSKMVTWIRSQPGTAELRALIYMDEMFGFAPPTAEPPSKRPILTILKQARAHGVGMVVSTQNPVDLDYKAMSNAGTWMVGRLQTENDKKRILDGLGSATGSVDLPAMSKLISDLEKRQFVLHSTKKTEPTLLTTRWVMSYMAGPLTRDDVSSLMENRKPTSSANPGPSVIVDVSNTDEAVQVAPSAAPGITTTYLDPAAVWGPKVGADPTATTLEAAVAATVALTYDDTVASVSHQEMFEAVIYPIDGLLDVDDVLAVDHDVRDFLAEPTVTASYRLPSVDLETRSFWSELDRDLKSHLVSHRKVKVFKNAHLKLYSRVGESQEDFLLRCRTAAEDAADTEMAKLKDRFQTRIDSVEAQVRTAESRLDTAETDAASRQQNEVLSGAGDLLGAFLGGRKGSNPLGRAASRRAATQKAQGKVAAEANRVEEKKEELEDLANDLAEAINEISAKYREMAEVIEEVEIPAEKTDISVVDLKLVWIPVR